MKEGKDIDRMQSVTELSKDPLGSLETWKAMKTDIEKYVKIKELVTKSFELVLEVMPPQVQITVQHKIDEFNDIGILFDYEELQGFLALAKVFTQTLMSTLDDHEVPDYAAPYRAVTDLDHVVRLDERTGYDESNVDAEGKDFVVHYYTLKERIKKIDWKKGWE